MSRHELLGEDFGTLELGSLATGTKGVDALVAERVDDARDQRRFRADDHQVRSLLFGKRNDLIGVAWIEGNRSTDRGDARVARRADDLHSAVLRQAPCKRMLARAPSNDENAHRQCRKWRTPVKTIAMLAASAAAMTLSSPLEPPG